MRVAIVDDENEMTEQIYAFLEKFQREKAVYMEIDVYHRGDAFVQGYKKEFDDDFGYTYDLIILDVEMPGINGIETAKEIRKVDTRAIIMFITNLAEYAIHGYEVEAVDYVLKPITYDDFSMKIFKALRYIERNVKKQIILHTSEGDIPVLVSDIYYVEVVRHYLYYYTSSGKYEVRGVMKELELELQGMNFKRCNQSYLVNLAHVRAIRGNDVVVGEDYVPISRNKKSDFMDAFAKYVGGLND